MEVSGQIPAPADLLPGKGFPVPIGQEAGWALEPFWRRWRREEILSLSLPKFSENNIREISRLLKPSKAVGLYIKV
jgi:hypothetical protein